MRVVESPYGRRVIRTATGRCVGFPRQRGRLVVRESRSKWSCAVPFQADFGTEVRGRYQLNECEEQSFAGLQS